MDHHCHALRCKVPTNPKMLMCYPHWSKVDAALKREVYRTVKLRGPHVDATWAPWWRAQERAISSVALADGVIDQALHDRRVARADEVANQLETRECLP